MRNENSAAISLFNDDQNPPQNQTLARRTPVAMPSRYRMLLHGK